MRLSHKLQLFILLIILLSFINFLKLLFIDILQRHTHLNWALISKKRPKAQFVHFNNNELFIYSSFIDARDGNMDFPFFRIIAIMSYFARHQYYCLFENERVKAEIYEMTENHRGLYGAYILNCRIPIQFMDKISKIKLTNTNKTVEITPNYYILPENSLKFFAYNYTICLPFLYGNFYSARYLIAAVEMYKLLGAQQITVYATRQYLDYDVQRVLRYYEAEKIIDVIDFVQPVKDIWNYAQLIVINDCLYRYMGRAKFVSFHDWDEFIVPAENTNLPTLFDNAFRFDSTVGSYRISTQSIELNPIHPFLLSSVRAQNELPDKRLTKCVLRPEMIFEQGIHHTSRVIQNHYKVLQLETNKAVLHHYRQKRYLHTHLERTIPTRYGAVLLQNCMEVLKKIFSEQ